MVRAVPASFDPAVVAQIDARLDDVERDQGVRIGWAVESGSRAWGFPSPDSDYDARFLYVRPVEDYLSPWRPRDVVETPVDAVLDVNGWDLVKAVDLAVRGNATVAEWLASPIVYRGSNDFRDDLDRLVRDVTDRRAVGRHYAHVAELQWHRHAADPDRPIPLKRFLYALRPAAAVAWMLEHPHASVPPMDLASLLDGVEVADATRSDVEALVRAKAATRELGTGLVPATLWRFVGDHVERGLQVFAPLGRSADLLQRREHAAESFRAMLARHAPSRP